MHKTIKASAIIAMLILFISVNITACHIDYNNSEEDKDLKVLHEKNYNISPGKKLKLEANSGDVMITGWDKSEVYIKVLGNEKASEKIDFQFSGDDQEIIIKAERKGSFFSWFGSGISLRFEIKVPSSFNNYVSTSGGDIRVGEINGRNLLKTSGGDISSRNLDGELKISTSGGDIKLDKVTGKIDASTSGGDINAVQFTGDLNVSTSGGDIKLKGQDSHIQAETSGGDIELNYSGENKGIEVSTSGGDIDIILPSNFGAAAKLNTSGGSIECNFSTNNITKISSHRFEADLNNGGNELIAKTSGGDIRVKKQN